MSKVSTRSHASKGGSLNIHMNLITVSLMCHADSKSSVTRKPWLSTGSQTLSWTLPDEVIYRIYLCFSFEKNTVRDRWKLLRFLRTSLRVLCRQEVHTPEKEVKRFKTEIRGTGVRLPSIIEHDLRVARMMNFSYKDKIKINFTATLVQLTTH